METGCSWEERADQGRIGSGGRAVCHWLQVFVLGLAGIAASDLLLPIGPALAGEESLQTSIKLQDYYEPLLQNWAEARFAVGSPRWLGFGIVSSIGVAIRSAEIEPGVGISDIRLGLALPGLRKRRQGQAHRQGDSNSAQNLDLEGHGTSSGMDWKLDPGVEFIFPISKQSLYATSGVNFGGSLAFILQQREWNLYLRGGLRYSAFSGIAANQFARLTRQFGNHLFAWTYLHLVEGLGSSDEARSVEFFRYPLNGGLGIGVGSSASEPELGGALRWRFEFQAELLGLLQEKPSFSLATGITVTKEWGISR